jgi:hypothetical protein
MQSLFAYSLQPGTPKEDDHNLDKMWAAVRATLLVAIILFAVGYLFYLYSRRDLYLDSVHGCAIKINEDILRGNPETIIDALNLIKKHNPEQFNTVCRFVSKIEEAPCYYGPYDDKRLEVAKTGGCYLKGTKIIFIAPEKDNTPDIITKRAENITKMAEFSKNYWNQLIL